jgi:pimeloyl-ACP methyl ester carboxylesterase
MPFAKANGAAIYYEECGAGYPIIFVHEMAADCREWENQVQWFSLNYRCITFNARGYPPSDVPTDRSQYGYKFSADDIAAVLDQLGIAKAHVVGLSMGAYATLQFGLRHPDRASALVVAGVGSGSPLDERDEFIRHSLEMAEKFVKYGSAFMAKEIGHSATRIQLKKKDRLSWEKFMTHLSEHDPVGMSNTLAMYQGSRPSLEKFTDSLKKLSVPVFLVVGDEDQPCLRSNLWLKQVIPGAGLWLVPNTGHAVNLEEPAAFNAQVQLFLTSVEKNSKVN